MAWLISTHCSDFNFFFTQDALLTTAISLAESFRFQPAHILCFPVYKSDTITDLELSVRSVSSDILTASIRPVSRPSSRPVSSTASDSGNLKFR